MAILVSWLLCFIFTVTNVFPPEKDKYGYYARTDARQGIIAAAPWFKIPYPCKSPLSLNPHSCRRIVFSNQTGQPAGLSDLLFSFLQQLHIKLSAFTWIRFDKLNIPILPVIMGCLSDLTQLGERTLKVL